MKIPNIITLYTFFAFPIVVICLFFIISGNVNIFYNGFALDNGNNIYLGKNSSIYVMNQNGEFKQNISAMTSRGYSFTISNENQILISTGDYLYTISLLGEVIEKKTINNYKEDPLININKSEYIDSNGKKYVMKNELFRTRIYRIEDNEKIMVYQMPILDYVIKLFFYAFLLSVFIIVPICIFQWRKIKM